jgi:D-cysteine desulfhydrase
MNRPFLYKRFPGLRSTLPHLSLSEVATPVRRLGELDRPGQGDAPIWLKDDGTFGGLWGGNKPRKLEWVLADARARGRRTVLTVGALATNHGLATALYARAHGMRTVLALADQPLDEHVRRQFVRITATGADVRLTHGRYRTMATVPLLMLRHFDLSRMRPPYFLTLGGSSPLGSLGFVEAALELADQIERGELPEPTNVVVAVGSGGTAAGLALGLRLAGLRTRVTGVLVNDRTPLSTGGLARLARRAERLLRRRGARFGPIGVQPADLDLETRWLGAGYGQRTPAAEAALELLALRSEGRFGDGPVLYWHTYDAISGHGAS